MLNDSEIQNKISSLISLRDSLPRQENGAGRSRDKLRINSRLYHLQRRVIKTPEERRAGWCQGAVKRRESFCLRWAPGGDLREAAQKREADRLAERQERERQREQKREAARLAFPEKNRKRALAAYYAKGDARLFRPGDNLARFKSAVRRLVRHQKRRQFGLQRAALSVVRKHNRHIQALLNKALRRRFQAAFKNCKNYSETIRQLTGCSLADLRAHLERQFQPGMSWDNYGFEGWHIDHKKPISKFDLTDPVQRSECFHFSNLQPLWAPDNMKKGAKSI